MNKTAICPAKKRKRCLSNVTFVIASYNHSINRVESFIENHKNKTNIYARVLAKKHPVY